MSAKARAPKVGYRWHLRMRMAERAMFATSDLVPLLAARGVVLSREQVYRRFDPRMIPDLIVTNTRGYRVSWQASLGVPTASVFEDNRDVWSGDHCSVDPEIVKGIFFYNRKVASDRAPYIADVYPTVLGLLNVKAPYALDGVELR